MIQVTSNMGEVVLGLKEKFERLKNPDGLLKTVAMAILPEMSKRVHEHGLDSGSSQIGTYSPAYMAIRTGSYGNSNRFSKGKNKGKPKDAGHFTKGQNATYDVKTKRPNTARPNEKRGADTKVILSLTSQMENDLSVVDTPNGYGIGYKNPFNLKKALWNEERYKKKILTELAKGETDLLIQVAESYIEEIINS